MIVDNTCMQMASKPQQFDVMVMPNLYGNIITNIACGLAGGQGLFPGANFSPTAAIFEQATRHAAKSIGGMDVANPSATILAGVGNPILFHSRLGSMTNSLCWLVFFLKRTEGDDAAIPETQ
mmetsp:Transcript_40835/g.161755  ORF Transcript_40835/g.161755 Transcript_40835/m.161755 type:complete len:122 (-) Transcript_40835:1528-1893(-)